MRELTMQEMDEVAGGWNFDNLARDIAIGVGAVAGGFIGGPVGAVIGAVVAGFIADNYQEIIAFFRTGFEAMSEAEFRKAQIMDCMWFSDELKTQFCNCYFAAGC